MTETIAFATAPPPSTYSVDFSENGLPSDLVWQVTVNGVPMDLTTNGAVETLTWTGLANGTYVYTITQISGWNQSTLPYGGSVVVNGASVAEPTLLYTQVTYAVTFTETGLASGARWSVNLSGMLISSTNSSVTFKEPNGSYPFTIAGTGYAASPASGTVDVSGGPVTCVIGFTPLSTRLSSVTFTETGLPSGTTWTVTLNGTTESSSADSILFYAPNGSQPFTVGSVSGYSSSPSSGSVDVNAGPASQSITFSSSTAASGFIGLSGDTGYYVLGGIVAAVAVAAAVAVLLHRLRKAPHSPTALPTQPGPSSPPPPG